MSQSSVQLQDNYRVFLGEQYSGLKLARLVSFVCFKRGFDLAAASVSLVLLLPLFLLFEKDSFEGLLASPNGGRLEGASLLREVGGGFFSL